MPGPITTEQDAAIRDNEFYDALKDFLDSHFLRLGNTDHKYFHLFKDILREDATQVKNAKNTSTNHIAIPILTRLSALVTLVDRNLPGDYRGRECIEAILDHNKFMHPNNQISYNDLENIALETTTKYKDTKIHVLESLLSSRPKATRNLSKIIHNTVLAPLQQPAFTTHADDIEHQQKLKKLADLVRHDDSLVQQFNDGVATQVDYWVKTSANYIKENSKSAKQKVSEQVIENQINKAAHEIRNDWSSVVIDTSAEYPASHSAYLKSRERGYKRLNPDSREASVLEDVAYKRQVPIEASGSKRQRQDDRGFAR